MESEFKHVTVPNVQEFLDELGLDYELSKYRRPDQVWFNILISQHERIKVLEELNDE